jgi:hypothetical protein
MEAVLSQEDVSKQGNYVANVREANVIDHNRQSMGVLRQFAKQVVGLCDAAEGKSFMLRPPSPMAPINITLTDGTTVIDEKGCRYRLRRITIRREMHMEK